MFVAAVDVDNLHVGRERAGKLQGCFRGAVPVRDGENGHGRRFPVQVQSRNGGFAAHVLIVAMHTAHEQDE